MTQAKPPSLRATLESDKREFQQGGQVLFYLLQTQLLNIVIGREKEVCGVYVEGDKVYTFYFFIFIFIHCLTDADSHIICAAWKNKQLQSSDEAVCAHVIPRWRRWRYASHPQSYGYRLKMFMHNYNYACFYAQLQLKALESA